MGVIAQCMSLDPRKRSLQGAREALERLVSFTTFDESLDDFCMAERRGIASANREPLRTPSIQSPQVDNGSFPWAKALHASPPQQFRQLSVIADDESYKDWFSVGQQTPSLASMLDSSLGASMKSMAIRRPMKSGPPKASLTPISGSLPITMSKPKPLPSLASIFGKKNEVVSKSWSDLWDEDIEEEEEEADKQLKARQMQNARTWSHESEHDEDDTIRRPPLEPKSSSFVNIAKPDVVTAANDIDGDLVADGFFSMIHRKRWSFRSTLLDTHHHPSEPLAISGLSWENAGERTLVLQTRRNLPSCGRHVEMLVWASLVLEPALEFGTS